MSASCSSIQSPGLRAVTTDRSPSSRRWRSSRGIVSAAWIVSASSWMSNGLTDRAYSPSSSCAPVFSRQDRDAGALVDHRPLLGDEVHAVEHRVDDQHVVVLVGGDRLLQVVAQLQLDRHPVRRAVAVVDHRHDRLDPLQVLRVLGDVGSGRHQLGDERDPLAELGVLLEEHIERGESAQDVLRQVRPVDPQDQMVAAPAQQLVPRTRASAPGRRRPARRAASIGSG